MAGPRTATGKLRTKFNATRHGIFSSVILLDGEPRADFDSLLEGLRKSLKPKGALVEILVEKLAISLWRYRRLLIAEGAEIQKEINFPSWNKNNKTDTISIIVTEEGHEGQNLMRRSEDPQIRETCLRLLKSLRSRIETGGFDLNRDSATLAQLYGDPKWDSVNGTLFASYRKSLSAATCLEPGRENEGSASCEDREKAFLAELDLETSKLERHELIQREKGRLEILRRNVPFTSLPDRLLRYEATLERNIDRTLRQLQLLQGIRFGHSASKS
jgi:hypothetical protein